eukprot:Sdes_comp19954_c0_seq2m12465
MKSLQKLILSLSGQFFASWREFQTINENQIKKIIHFFCNLFPARIKSIFFLLQQFLLSNRNFAPSKMKKIASVLMITFCVCLYWLMRQSRKIRAKSSHLV